MQHSQRAHATLAPSSAHRWMICTGSIRLSAGVEDKGSVFAAEGTAAHQLAEHCMDAGFDADRFHGFTVDTSGKHKPAIGQFPADGKTSFLVDSEMVDGVQTYLDTVRELANHADDFAIEQRMDMSDVVPGCYGTGDAVAYRSDLHRVSICDLKYGKGVPVDVEENEQLLTYALGVAQRYHNRGVEEVELIVVQPRAPHRNGPVRRWVTDVVTLYEHAMALRKAAKDVEDNPVFVAGDHCKFCKAAGFCGALQDRVFEIIGANVVNGEIMGIEDPAARPFRDWSKEQSDLNLINTWAKRREEFAHAEAMSGRMPPGAKLVGKRPTRKWKDEDAAVRAFAMLGVEDDVVFETKMRTPAAIEKELPKAQRDVIKELAESVSSGTVLAPLSDPRKAIDPENASGFEAMET